MRRGYALRLNALELVLALAPGQACFDVLLELLQYAKGGVVKALRAEALVVGGPARCVCDLVVAAEGLTVGLVIAGPLGSRVGGVGGGGAHPVP